MDVILPFGFWIPLYSFKTYIQFLNLTYRTFFQYSVVAKWSTCASGSPTLVSSGAANMALDKFHSPQEL